ncbi:hypothetical protein ACFP8Z_18900 [Gemmobacter lanyuensis]|uniref:hypothetical protein n=1 Tax=Gemmobacter lanyuensis TaxID=1054497 RepID=UPI00360C299A
MEAIEIGTIQGDRLDRLQVARLLWQTGRVEALDYAYGIAARALDDPDICLAYSHLVLSDAFRSDAPELSLRPRSSQVSGFDFLGVLDQTSILSMSTRQTILISIAQQPTESLLQPLAAVLEKLLKL